MPNEIQNKDHYLKIAKHLSEMANLFQKMVEGDVTLTHVAKTLNMHPSHLGPAMFKDNQLKSKLKIQDDSLKIIKASMSPYEKLIADIFRYDIRDIIITISSKQENHIDSVISHYLTEHQTNVISMVYGLYGKQSSTLLQIGKHLNLSQDRIRQIKETCLRKLRFRLVELYRKRYTENIVSPASDYGQIELLKEQIRLLNIKLSESESEIRRLNDKLFDNTTKETILNHKTINIEDLHLSTRTYNCLKRRGINTLYDITSTSEYEFVKLRNFGKGSLNELKKVLKIYGVEIGQFTTDK